MKKKTDQIRLLSIFTFAFLSITIPAFADDDLARPPEMPTAEDSIESTATPTVMSDSVEPTVAPTIVSPAVSPAMASPVPMQNMPMQNQSTVKTLGTVRTADMNIPALPPTQKMQAQQNGTVAYMTGGVGQEEREALETAKNNYNLHITIANGDGQFLADTRIIIRNQAGQEILEAVAGPIFYAQVPAGSYSVEAASSEGQTKKQNVVVGKAGKANRPSSLHFTW
jgi:hypothetical protein